MKVPTLFQNVMLRKLMACASLLLIASAAKADVDVTIHKQAISKANTIKLAENNNVIPVVIDDADFECVKIAANLFCDDMERVTDVKSAPVKAIPGRAAQILIAGTIGHSPIVDKLIADGRIDVSKIKGQWEATQWFIVKSPASGIDNALVIVGSDRRGTAFGLMELSEKIGVSPWYWWDDVAAQKSKTLVLEQGAKTIDAPKVRYRGIFINDEDWGLHEWAKNNFEKDGFKRIGAKTNEKLFELLLRLRMNCFWPAMHECSVEFCAVPENPILADRYGIVTGASHCEPMLRNNCHWDQRTQGPWNYVTNQANIDKYWQESVDMRSNMENIWTVGMRGIHDSPMQGANTTEEKKALVAKAIDNQLAMIDKGVSKQYGDIPMSFIPYKEVLPVYDAGLKLRDDITLMWVDDNYGYIRRLSSQEEQKRSGGAGVYYHISYYGGIHSYCEINTTPPALMQHEMLKAYDNNTKHTWILNVGDGKPGEIGMSYWAKLSWDPDAHRGSNDQKEFLTEFAKNNFPGAASSKIADLLDNFYRLGIIRKPEIMSSGWAKQLRADQAAFLKAGYEKLLADYKEIENLTPEAERDGLFELVGYANNMFANSGIIFMKYRDMIAANQQLKLDSPEISENIAAIDAGRSRYNLEIKNGKWNYFIPDLIRTRNNGNNWSTHMQWPWNDPPRFNVTTQNMRNWNDSLKVVPASQATLKNAKGNIMWQQFNGLGLTGSAVALVPMTIEASFQPDDNTAPAMDFEFNSDGKDFTAIIDCVPTYALYPSIKCRITVLLNDEFVNTFNLPASESSNEGSYGNRGVIVDDNYARIAVPLKNLKNGKNILTIRAVDPNVAIDSVCLPK